MFWTVNGITELYQIGFTLIKNYKLPFLAQTFKEQQYFSSCQWYKSIATGVIFVESKTQTQSALFICWFFFLKKSHSAQFYKNNNKEVSRRYTFDIVVFIFKKFESPGLRINMGTVAFWMLNKYQKPSSQHSQLSGMLKISSPLSGFPLIF